jgi:hypothetical protein
MKLQTRKLADFNEFLALLPYTISFVAVGIPLVRSQRDMWDGAVISYAFINKDYSGIQNWLLNSGWDLQYLLIRIQFEICQQFNLSFKLITIFTVMLALFLINYQTKFIAQHIFNLPAKWALFSSCLVSVMPMWSTLISSVLTFHILALALGLALARGGPLYETVNVQHMEKQLMLKGLAAHQ